MPIINIFGFSLPLLILEEGRYQTPGKKLKKQVKISTKDHGDNHCLSEIFRALRHSIRTFAISEKSAHTVYHFTSNTTLDVIFYIHALAKRHGLFLVASSFARAPNSIVGYALTRATPADITNGVHLHPRILHFLVRNAQDIAPFPWDSIDECGSIELLSCRYIGEIRDAISYFTADDSVVTMILAFACSDILLTPDAASLDPLHLHYLHSVDTWIWIFLHTVHISPTDDTMQSHIASAAKSILKSKLRANRSWNFTFFGRCNHIYFWNESMYPLIAKPYPVSLDALKELLTLSHPLAAQLPECLPAVYNKPNHHLNYHRDIEGRSFYGTNEALILQFSGFPRTLKFKPAFSFFPDELIFSIKCTDDICLTISPLANEYFFHSKAKSNSTQSSVTFAWRRGIHIDVAKIFYPHLHKFKNL